MNTILECDTCTAEAIGVQQAIKHVNEYPGHVMSGTDEEDGVTTKISKWDDTYDSADDWNAADQ
jgi:hypothetical protein